MTFKCGDAGRNSARMEQHLKCYIELIVLQLFLHLIIRNHLWPQQIRRGKQILSNQNDLFAHLHHLYLIRVIGLSRNIILCYKGCKDTIVPVAEFTRCNLSVLFLSKGKAKIVWLATSLIARKAAFLHKKELSGVVCLSFRPPTEFVIFCPINYRPVSLTSVVVKSLERLIQNHIMSFVSDNKLLRDKQHGFSCSSLSRRVAWYS